MSSVAWHPTHRDEFTETLADRFAAQTFEVAISSNAGVSGVAGRIEIRRMQINAAVFVSARALLNTDENNVIVYFGAWMAGERGLEAVNRGRNDALTHGLRGALNDIDCVLICLPGPPQPGNVESGNYFTIDDEGIKACLTAAGRQSTKVNDLRLCAFSRGARGLRETLKQGLIRRVRSRPDFVTIFDAAYPSVGTALEQSGIPASATRAYQVIVKERLSHKGAINVDLDPNAMRAIGFSRAISNLIFLMGKGVGFPTTFEVGLAKIRGQLLDLPPKGKFSTRISSPDGAVPITEWIKLADNARKIDNIVSNEKKETGLLAFIVRWNVLFFGFDNRDPPEPIVFPQTELYSHHLFVGELAHELGWPVLGTVERFRNAP